MSNRFKIAATVLVVIVGMVLYKISSDKREDEDDDKEGNKKARASDRRTWN